MTSKKLKAKINPAHVGNIEHLLDTATKEQWSEGEQWYDRAAYYARGLADQYGLDVRQACELIAVLSPNTSWAQNIVDAEALASWHAAGRVTDRPNVVTYPKNIEKALRILNGERDALTGPKVRAFAALLFNPSHPDIVCVDGHTYNLTTGRTVGTKHALNVTAKRRRDTVAAIRRVAFRLNLRPCQVQAIAWVVWRGVWKSLAAA
jgi:hypothetical protein